MSGKGANSSSASRSISVCVLFFSAFFYSRRPLRSLELKVLSFKSTFLPSYYQVSWFVFNFFRKSSMLITYRSPELDLHVTVPKCLRSCMASSSPIVAPLPNIERFTSCFYGSSAFLRGLTLRS
jgi:hypothetical protein